MEARQPFLHRRATEGWEKKDVGLGRSRYQAVWIKVFNQDSLSTGLITHRELQKLRGTVVKLRSVGPAGTGSNPSSVTY